LRWFERSAWVVGSVLVVCGAILIPRSVLGLEFPGPDLTEQEVLEIAVGRADAIVEGFVAGPWDTSFATRPGALRNETWIDVRVQTKLKGSLSLGPGSRLRVLVHEDDRAQLIASRGRTDPGLLFLFRNDPGRLPAGMIDSNLPWVLTDPVIWLKSDRGERTLIQELVRQQSLESLVRRADLVIVGRAGDDEAPCAGPHGATCLSIMVDSVLVGRFAGPQVPVTVQGFGISPGPAIYFLERSRSRRFELVAKTGGILEPGVGVKRPEWFSSTTRIIRRLRAKRS
jgi:hypothetical protein